MNTRFILLPSLLATALLAAGSARADSSPSVTGIVGTVTRLEPDEQTSADNANEHPHPAGVPANVIDLDDCLGNLGYEIDLGISSLNSGYNLTVWAGTEDCTPSAARLSSTPGCWPVVPFVAVTTNPFHIFVRMQDIVSQAFTTQHSTSYTPSTDSSVCAPTGGATSKALSLYFFFADAEGNAVGTATTYPVTLDLVTNPTPVDGGVGDGGTGSGATGASGGGGCTVASTPADPSTGLTLALGVGVVALVRRRQRATGTRRARVS